MAKIKWILTSLVTIGLVVYAAFNWDSFRELRIIVPAFLLLGVATNVLTFYLQGLIGVVIFRHLGSMVTVRESVALGVITNLTNFFVPMRGGLAARAVYLKKVHSLSYDRFLSSVLAYYVPNIILTALFATVSLAYLRSVEPSIHLDLLLIGASLSLGAGILMTISPPIPEKWRTKSTVLSKLYEAFGSWHGVKGDRRVVMQLSLLTIAEIIVSLVQFFAVYASLGIMFSLAQLTALMSLTNISGLFSFTPSNLGIFEAVGVFVTQSMGITPVEVIAATMLTRLLQIVMLSLASPLASYYLTSKLGSGGLVKTTLDPALERRS